MDKGMMLLLSVCSSHKNNSFLCIRVVFVLGGSSGGFVQTKGHPFYTELNSWINNPNLLVVDFDGFT